MQLFNLTISNMKKIILFSFFCICFLISNTSNAQVKNDKIGAWYMYFFNTTFSESSWGLQGDIQYRNWNLGGDLEQLLLRGGITYKPKQANIKFTLGYGNITSGSIGPNTATTSESRIYQEALFPVQFGKRFFTNHRFRYEQRFVETLDFRTRYRYNIFLNVPLNKPNMDEKTLYLALYNEIFINGQRDIGNGKNVELFDRNRLYIAAGYVLSKDLKIQAGIMNQLTNGTQKNQLQFSLHHKF